MIEDAAFWVVPVLLASAFIGGWVDSVAGGGGMVTIPIMLAVGVPPDMVLGTNKLQASFGSFTATVHYARKGVIDPASALTGVLWTAVGAAVGGYAVQQLDASVLNLVIPFMLLGIALFMVFTPSLGARQNPPG